MRATSKVPNCAGMWQGPWATHYRAPSAQVVQKRSASTCQILVPGKEKFQTIFVLACGDTLHASPKTKPMTFSGMLSNSLSHYSIGLSALGTKLNVGNIKICYIDYKDPSSYPVINYGHSSLGQGSTSSIINSLRSLSEREKRAPISLSHN